MYRTFLHIIVVISVMASSVFAVVPQLIHYQGFLAASGPGNNPVNGTVDVTFSIWDQETNGTQIWSEIHMGVVVEVGNFNVLLGSVVTLNESHFSDSVRFLQIQVAADPPLTPRNQLVSVPFAFRVATVDGAIGGEIAGNLSVSDTAKVGSIQLSGGVSRDVLTSDAAGVGTWQAPSSSHWSVIDTVLYTNANWGISRGQAGNSLRGDSAHTAVNLGTLSITGSLLQLDGTYQTVSGGWANGAHGKYSTVSGGIGNNAYGDYSVISGGQSNVAVDEFSTVGGGVSNQSWGRYNTVAGGNDNLILGEKSSIGGGMYNKIDGDYSVIGGGYESNVTGNYSVIGGGFNNTANNNGNVLSGSHNVAEILGLICGGNKNSTGTYGGGTVGGGEYNFADRYSVVAGGDHNSANRHRSVIGGGAGNQVDIAYSVIAGGWSNEIVESGGVDDTASVISGGLDNKIDTKFSTIGGGRDNLVSGQYSAILGGFADTISASAHYSYLFGIKSKLTQDSTFMVDMPHIRFGDEVNGYEFPATDGDSGQVMTTNGNQQLSWSNQSTGGVGNVPIGAVISWLKSFPGTPTLPIDNSYVECDGQILNDTESLFNGQTIPDLNGSIGTQRFLRGSTGSGSTGGSELHIHSISSAANQKGPGNNPDVINFNTNNSITLPSFYEVVWIMRVK